MEEKKAETQGALENDNATCRVPDSNGKGFPSVAFVAAGIVYVCPDYILALLIAFE